MSDPAGLLLSVRGEARRMVPPDCAVVTAGIACLRGSKAEAVGAAAAELDGLTADLAAQGGVALDADTGRRPLTWSAQSATTHVEHAYDDKTGRHEPTGQVTAVVAVVITVRAFGLLDALGGVLAAHEAVSVHHVHWQVDWDNPAWQTYGRPPSRPRSGRLATTPPRSGGRCGPWSMSPTPCSSAATRGSPGSPAPARWRARRPRRRGPRCAVA